MGRQDVEKLTGLFLCCRIGRLSISISSLLLSLLSNNRVNLQYVVEMLQQIRRSDMHVDET